MLPFASRCGFCLIAVTLLTGCQPEGPARYALSGSITYQGKPVPGGEIHFTPDAAANNSGPGSFATIKNGRYETLPGKGTVGGPHTLTVICFSAVPGEVAEEKLQELCPPQQLTIELPTADGNLDLALPSSSR